MYFCRSASFALAAAILAAASKACFAAKALLLKFVACKQYCEAKINVIQFENTAMREKNFVWCYENQNSMVIIFQQGRLPPEGFVNNYLKVNLE